MFCISVARGLYKKYRTKIVYIIVGKVEGKGAPITSHEGPEGE